MNDTISYLHQEWPKKYQAVMNYIDRANKIGWPSVLLVFDDDTAVNLYFRSGWVATYYADVIRAKGE